MDISFACGAVRSLAGSLRGQRTGKYSYTPAHTQSACDLMARSRNETWTGLGQRLCMCEASHWGKALTWSAMDIWAREFVALDHLALNASGRNHNRSNHSARGAVASNRQRDCCIGNRSVARIRPLYTIVPRLPHASTSSVRRCHPRFVQTNGRVCC